MKLISDYAIEISTDWKNIPRSASAYLDCMADLEHINDMYMHDSARSIILRFLCNASQWKGDTARRIKAELKQLCK
jgi:hypothetical protein